METIPSRCLENINIWLQNVFKVFRFVLAGKKFLGSVCIPQTKSFYKNIEKRLHWDAIFDISDCLQF